MGENTELELRGKVISAEADRQKRVSDRLDALEAWQLSTYRLAAFGALAVVVTAVGLAVFVERRFADLEHKRPAAHAAAPEAKPWGWLPWK